MQVSHLICSGNWLSRRIRALDEGNHPGIEGGLTTENGDRTCDDVEECTRKVLVVDCRPTEAYHATRIGGALSLSLPTLMARRLARRQLAASTVIGVIQQQQQRGRQVTTEDWKQRVVVFYDESTSVPPSAELFAASSCLVMLLAQRFNDDGHYAMILEGR